MLSAAYYRAARAMRYPDVNKFALDTRIYMYYMVLSNKVVGIEMPRKRQKRAPLSLSLSFYIYLYVYIHLYIFLQRAVCISVLKKKEKKEREGGHVEDVVGYRGSLLDARFQ